MLRRLEAALSEREAGAEGGALAPRGVSSAPGGGASALRSERRSRGAEGRAVRA